MEHTAAQVRAFRYWIQGYQNFYEPIVEAYFPCAGYTVLRRPARVEKPDIQIVIDALFDGKKTLGPPLQRDEIEAYLRKRIFLQPDLLLEKEGKRYLAELKSWGGYSQSGQFTYQQMEAEFLRKLENAAFLLVDRLDGLPIAGKLLVISSRSADHDRILMTMRRAYNTSLEILYLDEILRCPQLVGVIDRQCRYLDAATAELKQALGVWPTGGDTT